MSFHESSGLFRKPGVFPNFNMPFRNCLSRDSNGFFRRQCACNEICTNRMDCDPLNSSIAVCKFCGNNFAKLRLLLTGDKSENYVSAVLDQFVKDGTIQDLDALLAHYGYMKIYGTKIPVLVMRNICSQGRQDLLDHMLSLGFQVDSACLGNVVLYENHSMIDFLLSIGCKIPKRILYNVKDTTIATKLIRQGANVNYQHPIFEPPLESAISKNRIDMALLLLSAGAAVTEHTVRLAKKNGNQELINAM